MNQALYAHMNNKRKKSKIKKENWETVLTYGTNIFIDLQQTTLLGSIEKTKPLG
jgi:hypothetical protein